MFPNVNIEGFSLAVCRLMARAAAAAYGKAAEFEAMVRAESALDSFHFIDDKNTGTQCFLIRRGNDVVIAFRGTSDLQDWRTDIKVRRNDWDGRKVHRGFATAFEAVRKTILEEVLPGYDRYRIWITGHSLGGALAILCASNLERHGCAVRGVYTFGQPRVGDGKFARDYDDRLKRVTFRLVNENDFIPRSPFWLMGYRHCGQEIFVNSFGGVDLNPTWRQKIRSDLWGLARELNIVSPPLTVTKLGTDHFMAGYTALLK